MTNPDNLMPAVKPQTMKKRIEYCVTLLVVNNLMTEAQALAIVAESKKRK